MPQTSNSPPFWRVLERTQIKGKYYCLVLGETLDREINSQYNVTIIATDEGTPSLSSTSIITLMLMTMRHAFQNPLLMCS
ncbi:unnamed protein product [Coregonus sp. 'balchen']|nr:unnamed protein product [Coregonus sp. 'balchen']